MFIADFRMSGLKRPAPAAPKFIEVDSQGHHHARGPEGKWRRQFPFLRGGEMMAAAWRIVRF